MRNTFTVWRFVHDHLENGMAVCLLYVLDSSGSSPGRQGFCMAVDAEGAMEGSIGGGLMEHNMVDLSRNLLMGKGVPGFPGTVPGDTATPVAANPTGPSVRRQIHASSGGAYASGMICSGEQTLFVYPIQPNAVDPEAASTLATVKSLCASLEAGENGGGVLRLSATGIAFEKDARMNTAFRYMGPRAQPAGQITEGGTAPDNAPGASPAAGRRPVVVAPADSRQWLYEERIGHRDKLFIVGGGHCSLAFSQIARNLDFYVEVIDNRPGLNTLERNSYAHRKRVVESYSELAAILPEGEDVYVVVMTFGYKSDDVAVRAILDKNFKYFGLLGSRKKIETMFAAYTAEGIATERLRRIHAPVGIPIKSRSPEEIAVSIAAEIIGVRNRFLP